MLKKYALPVAVALTAAGVSAVVAQTIEGLDIQAIEKRSAEHSAEAQELFDFATTNAKAHETDAEQVAQAGYDAVRSVDVSHVAGPQGPVDLDAMLSGAKSALTEQKAAPLFIAFASLSMPEEALSKMIADTTNAGGVIVFRGFSAGSPKPFIAGIQKVVDQQGASNIAIDPRLFRAFKVDRVPTYVAVSSGFEPCDQLDCVSDVPPYDVIAGNISAEYALSTFVEGGGPGAEVARVALGNLKGGT